MKSLVYKLTKPGVIEEIEQERFLKQDWVAIEPVLGSICHADLRYFTGNRRADILQKKLPMALLHEGIGKVIESQSPNYKRGDRVVIVPNIPARLLGKEQEGESDNYSKNGAFLGSGYDGIAQSRMVHPAQCLVKIPDELEDTFAVLAELNSVSVRAMRAVEENLKQKDVKVAVFGDGPVGYLTACYIRYAFNLSSDQLTVFGADEIKLSAIDFAKTEDVRTFDFTKNLNIFDVVVECTGGKFSEHAINQSIGIMKRESHLVLMGVSEQLVAINTRDTLEKGLTIHGSSRSTVNDFQCFMKLIHESAEYKQAMSKILPDDYVIVKNGEDFKAAMHVAASKPHWKKIILQFDWT